MELYKSGEDYLETILVLKNKLGQVRSIDVVNSLSYSKPSVSRAMSILKKGGYITIDKDGYIEFTESGLGVAEEIYHRHTTLEKWLISLGVAPDIASQDACNMEHVISQETFEKISVLLKNMKNRPA